MASRLVAQVLGRAFVGPRLCRDADWLDISTTYVANRMTAAVAVQRWGSVLQPIVHWFLPSCRRLRTQVQRARELLQPELDRVKDNAVEDETFTSLAWIHGYAQGLTYDAGLAHLRLTAVANHTTSDMLTKILFRICENPELIQSLREEAVAALRKGGLTVASLQKMFLMESVMKESQRLEPFFLRTVRSHLLVSYLLTSLLLLPSLHVPVRDRNSRSRRRLDHSSGNTSRRCKPKPARPFHLPGPGEVRRLSLRPNARRPKAGTSCPLHQNQSYKLELWARKTGVSRTIHRSK